MAPKTNSDNKDFMLGQIMAKLEGMGTDFSRLSQDFNDFRTDIRKEIKDLNDGQSNLGKQIVAITDSNVFRTGNWIIGIFVGIAALLITAIVFGYLNSKFNIKQ